MADPLERLKVLIGSNTPLVVIETVEEMRAVTMVRTACQTLNLPVFEWDIADGLTRYGLTRSGSTGIPAPIQPRNPIVKNEGVTAKIATLLAGDAKKPASARNKGFDPLVGALAEQATAAAIYNTREPAQVLAHLETMSMDAVFVLKDFHRHIDDPVVVRRLRTVAQEFYANRRTLVITSPSISLPLELASLVEYLDLPLPDAKRLRRIVEETFALLSKNHTLKGNIDSPGLDRIAENLRGLTEEEAERTVSQAIVAHNALSAEVNADIVEAKKNALRRSGMLEFVAASENLSDVGGLENLKQWLSRRMGAWEPAARAFGLEPSRGVIIFGVQGCGKSMCARAIAGEWKLPLVKFDTAAVFDKYVGETEKHIRKLLQVADQLAPAVLWIDEFEKIFAGGGTDSAASDAGVSARMMGTFLSWMQERKQPVFVAATSNNINALPPELIRKGRFDDLFFVDLPNAAERRAIFHLHLARRKQDGAQFDLDRLAIASKGHSGAEIEASIQTAMFACYARKEPLDTECLVQALRSTVPLSETRAEEIQALRRWAHQRAVAASEADTETAGTTS
ncbi:MAG TPA: AAA family ATPase [Candidatus Angelobacter sp.]|nr:AAA family ATPase [Candidatus Angelobacter sp.]